MSAVKRTIRRLERYRAKAKGKSIPEPQGRGKADARAGKAINIKAALAQKKKSGKPAREFDNLDLAALQARLEETRKELFNLRFRHATRQLESTAAIPAAKRRIARILTLIKQKEVGA
jgi:large subunit ribosomal protein L29